MDYPYIFNAGFNDVWLFPELVDAKMQNKLFQF